MYFFKRLWYNFSSNVTYPFLSFNQQKSPISHTFCSFEVPKLYEDEFAYLDSNFLTRHGQLKPNQFYYDLNEQKMFDVIFSFV